MKFWFILFRCYASSTVIAFLGLYLIKYCLIFAFDVGRTLPNTDLSRDFMELVVDGSADDITKTERAWDRDWPGDIERTL